MKPFSIPVYLGVDGLHNYGAVIEASIRFPPPQGGYGGSYGFSVQWYNGISKVTTDVDTSLPVLDYKQLLDPLPLGTGEWLTVALPKWEYNWVQERLDLENI